MMHLDGANDPKTITLENWREREREREHQSYYFFFLALIKYFSLIPHADIWRVSFHTLPTQKILGRGFS
jgi:hypothetical protein